MKYLKLFEAESEYLTYRDGADYLKPNVSLSNDKGEVYYNYSPPPIVYEAVDLGLPSGTKWAAQNVGARKPSEAGLYFQWGDTSGYTAEQVGKDKQFASDESDYKFGVYPDYTKYTNPGDTLDLEDDAAHVNMGGDWHIPSPSQIKELIDNTTSEWTEQDDVKGRLFTSKKDSSKSIFIPAAGYASGGSVNFSGSFGYVWSTLLIANNVNHGHLLRFYSDNSKLDYGYRYYGFSVRGVIDKKVDYSKGKKNNMEAKEGRSIEGIVNQMKNDLSIKIKKEDAGYVVVDLLYKNEVIDSDWGIDTDLNPLGE